MTCQSKHFNFCLFTDTVMVWRCMVEDDILSWQTLNDSTFRPLHASNYSAERSTYRCRWSDHAVVKDVLFFCRRRRNLPKTLPIPVGGSEVAWSSSETREDVRRSLERFCLSLSCGNLLRISAIIDDLSTSTSVLVILAMKCGHDARPFLSQLRTMGRQILQPASLDSVRESDGSLFARAIVPF